MRPWTACSFLGVLHLAHFTSGTPPSNIHGHSTIIDRDVAIIGGGSSGTYTAVRLKDKGKHVALIEKRDVLGGHTETYMDPATGIGIDYGVIYWHDTPIVRNYTGRFDIKLKTVSPVADSAVETRYIDFQTGKKVDGYMPGDPAPATKGYIAQLAKYPFLDKGYTAIPNPVPEDLLLPFGDFVKKYDLGGVVQVIFNIGQGIGNLLAHPTLNVAKLVGISTLAGSQTGFVNTDPQDNQGLYQKAGEYLGKDNVFLNHHVHSIHRPKDGKKGPVHILMSSPQGRKLIRAKQLVIAIPQTIDNLCSLGLDIDDDEDSLFSKWKNSAYYTGILKNTGLPPNVSFTNIGPDPAPYNLPQLPAPYAISQSPAPDLFSVYYGSDKVLPSEQVTSDITDIVGRLGGDKAKVEFAVFRAHTPFLLYAPASDVRNGFYDKVDALQGRRETFYNGAAFQTQDSSLIWQFTEEILLPRILGEQQ